MPQLSKTSMPHEYNALRQDSSSCFERNDCTVVAVALLANVTYEVAHAALKAEGRKNGKGAYIYQYKTALEKLGKTVVAVSPESIIRTYPAGHCRLKSITTHHPRRFKKVWPQNKNYLVQVHRHALAIIQGETKDWTINRALRIRALYEVI